MNHTHLLPCLVIASMILSSVVSILFVTIQNAKAVKKYYSTLPSGNSSVQSQQEINLELSSSTVTTIFTEYATQEFSIAS